MKKLIIAIIAVSVAIVICAVILISGVRPKNPPPAAYEIYVYLDGSAQIELDSVNQIIQTHEDLSVGEMELKAGTIILPGNGNEIYYEYPRRDHILNRGEEENEKN